MTFRVKLRRTSRELAYVQVEAKDQDEALQKVDEEVSTGEVEWAMTDASEYDVDDVTEL